jgi:hypothetical protein
LGETAMLISGAEKLEKMRDGRHQLYEKFYAGSSITVRKSCRREAPWDTFHGIVDDFLDQIEI